MSNEYAGLVPESKFDALQAENKALKESRDELLVISKAFQGLANKEGVADSLPQQMANLNRAISKAQAQQEKEADGTHVGVVGWSAGGGGHKP